MASAATTAKAAKRQHFIARFYLRNFAEPIFSDNLCVYDMRKQRWEKRTPRGVGWFPHLCSMIDMQGNRSDDFDRFLKLKVEDPAAPALKKLATGGTVDANERAAVALFVALTAARSPEMMKDVMTGYVGNLAASDRAELDAMVKPWCEWTGKPYDRKSHSEFLKPSSFGGIWEWSQSLQRRLLQWEWHLVHTTRDRPFITSDRPVFADWDRERDLRLVSFPVSSEVALIVIAGGKFNEAHDRTNEVYAINLQTMDRASEFVVACKESFPGDDYLTRRVERL
ncbi:hypothetical protein LCGC14_1285000 [marine sediment metagenome]|uniref:DUF4238 domain-containing protein n=1 Tax=marine sediment metagenome TaxID=412755 RepID=A0A0F9NAT8_9ZZZZ